MSDLQSNGDNNMVNLFNSRLKEIHLEEKINETRQKLDQWRDECHKTVDDYYQRKLNQFNSYVDDIRTKHSEKSSTIQKNLSQLTGEENNQTKETLIRSIEQDLKDIEETILQVHLQSLTIDENAISIEKTFDCRNITEPSSIFQYSSESSSAIASNERCLLMHQQSYLNLIDQDCTISRQIVWPHDWIRDMCWSTILKCFIVITAKNIYFVNEKLEFCSPLQDHLQQNWFSCTCSDEFLYISTCQWSSSIFQLSLTSPVDLIKEWKCPLTCRVNEGINDIKYNNKTIAILIKDPKEYQRRLDLKSAETFNTIWSYSLGISASIHLFTCCPISSNEWLVIDGTTRQISQITKDGKLKANVVYPSVPYRANFFQSIVLAVSAEDNLEFYRLSA